MQVSMNYGIEILLPSSGLKIKHLMFFSVRQISRITNTGNNIR